MRYNTTSWNLKSSPPGQHILSILDLDQSFFHELEKAQFENFIRLVTKVPGDSGILWVTGAAQVTCTDPRYAMVHGVMRGLRAEINPCFATLELESFGDKNIRIVPHVLQEFKKRILEPDVHPNVEWAHRRQDIDQSTPFHRCRKGVEKQRESWGRTEVGPASVWARRYSVLETNVPAGARTA